VDKTPTKATGVDVKEIYAFDSVSSLVWRQTSSDTL
jgi:hypothetical protein